MIAINMLDGEVIEIHADTVLVGINNCSETESPEKQVFYLRKEYEGNLRGDYEPNGSALLTVDERLGIGGFLLSHKMFSIGDGPDKTIYFVSAVKSISVV